MVLANWKHGEPVVTDGEVFEQKSWVKMIS